MNLKTGWVIPAKTTRMPDGSFSIRPGTPVQRVKAAEAESITGISRKVLARLAECGIIRCLRPSPAIVLYFPAEIEEFLAQTEADPDFWNDIKVKAYLTGQRLRDASAK